MRALVAVAVFGCVAVPSRFASAEGGAGRPAPLSERVDARVARARADGLASRAAWLRLGHYRERWWGGHRSEVDGPAFFLAKNGQGDPAAELEATVRAFHAPVPHDRPDEHAICRFPARLAWLAQQGALALPDLPQVRCKKLGEFIERLQPVAVKLIFSSYYLNNPASAFGHTFLRVDNARARAGQGKRDILNFGVDFAASADERNAVLYAFKGLFGMFKGEFHAMPYYYKVREYNDFESRDIWEYELGLAPDQVALLVTHIWELGQTHIDYYYIDENCSYHILGVLGVIRPDEDFLAALRTPVLPADTVKVANAVPGFIKDVKFRPSIRTQFRARVEALGAGERAQVASLARDPGTPMPADFTVDTQRRVLDASLDLVDMREARALLAKEDAVSDRKQRLLERRAAIHEPSPDLDFAAVEARAPHLGHPSMRAGAGGGFSPSAGSFLELDLRLAMHDLADPARGYPETVALEFLPVRARYYAEERRVHLEEASFVQIVSLSPVDRFDPKFSWRFRLGATTLRDRGCTGDCNVAAIEAGGGGAVGAFDDALILFALADVGTYWSPALSGGAGLDTWRIGLGPLVGARLRLGARAAFVATGQALALPWQTPWYTWRSDAVLRVALASSFAVGLEARAQPRAVDARLMLTAYF